MGFDTHMILETVPVLPSTRQNAHQVINPTSRHYAEAVVHWVGQDFVMVDTHPIPGSYSMTTVTCRTTCTGGGR
jgi:hypothetical protein